MELLKISKPSVVFLKEKQTYPDRDTASKPRIGSFELALCSYGKEPTPSDHKQLGRARNTLHAYTEETLKTYCMKWFKVQDLERALLFAANNQFPLSDRIYYIIKPV